MDINGEQVDIQVALDTKVPIAAKGWGAQQRRTSLIGSKRLILRTTHFGWRTLV